MTRAASYLLMVVLAGWGTVRGVEEAVRVYIERACRRYAFL